MHHWSPSSWLIQSSPPDMAENRNRWTFGLYEILDRRETPVSPKVLHTVYRGVVELDAARIPDAKDPLFALKLEEAVTQRWRELQLGLQRKAARADGALAGEDDLTG